MSSGYSHYLEAERLIAPDYAETVVPAPPDDPTGVANRLALAQVHADLAKAAATARPEDPEWDALL